MLQTISDRPAEGCLHLTIPEDLAFRYNIHMKNHDDPVRGHYGIDKTTNLLKRKYHWKCAKRDVHDYVSQCAPCQLNKI
jgi:hypothetical protein